MLDVISQDNSRNYVFHFEIKAKVALQEERVGARGKDLRSGTPSLGSRPPPLPWALPSSQTLSLLPPGPFQLQLPTHPISRHFFLGGRSSWQGLDIFAPV